MDVKEDVCTECNKTFSSLSNLKKHIKNVHPDKRAYLDSLQIRKNKNYKFRCDKCNRHFMHLKHLRYHAKTHGDYIPNTNPNIQNKQCAICDFRSNKKTVIEHYIQFHNISIEQKRLTFQTEEEFFTWKLTFENDTNSKFVLLSRKSCKTHVSTDYICHRSGRYVPEGKNLRQLKRQGSNKINAVCPASIKMKLLNNGTAEVTLIDKHVGHSNDIEYLNLSEKERECLAVKIAENVPFENILSEIRNSVNDSELKRLHLLTRKDLFNIRSCFSMHSSSAEYKNDGVFIQCRVDLDHDDDNQQTGYDQTNLVIEVDEEEDKEEKHVEAVQAPLKQLYSKLKPTTTPFITKKRKILNLLKELQLNVHCMTSEMELDVVENAIIPIKQTLTALHNNKKRKSYTREDKPKVT